MSESNTVQQLKYARALVKTGWIKGMSRDISRFGGRRMYCTSGALCQAGACPGDSSFKLVKKHLSQILGSKPYYGIPWMNDRFLTRKRHVLKAFDLAIIEAEGLVERQAPEAEPVSIISVMRNEHRELVSV